MKVTIANIDYIPATEAAARLGVARQAVHAYVQRGFLRSVLIGTVRFVSVEDLARYRRENLGRRGRKPRKNR